MTPDSLTWQVLEVLPHLIIFFRVCWSVNCKKAVTTSQLVNDENLRQRVEKYLKGELDNCQVGGGVGDVQAEHDKSVSSSSNNIEMGIKSDEDHQPSVKKFKNIIMRKKRLKRQDFVCRFR